MEYLLVMTISGSTMTCLYLISRRLLRERLCAGVYYFLAKAAVLYYLIPLPFVKSWYREILPSVVWQKRREPERILLNWTNHTVLADGGLHVNVYALLQAVVAVIWILGACVRLMRRLKEYLWIVRRFGRYAKIRMTEQEEAFICALRKEYGIRRRVSFIRARDGDPTFTFGIIKPIIICGRDPGSREAELLARHEMVHIRKLDVLWKIFIEFAALLHWWNPFMRKLYGGFERISECACDETVMRGTTKEERQEYLILLVEESREKKPQEITPRWNAGFASAKETEEAKREIRERMNNLMRKKGWNRLAAGVLVGTLIFANSMTVFAYRDGVKEILPEDVSQEEIETIFDKDVSVFVPDDTNWEAFQNVNMEEVVEILYESQFTDEEGNVYPVPEDDGVDLHCNHVYISGELQDHYPHSDGSCEVKIYRAQRCSKCGQIVRGDLLRTITYNPCPH